MPLRMKRTPDVWTKVINSSISAFVCGSSANAIEAVSSSGEDGSEKLAHEIDVSVLAGCSEQPLDRQPAYHLDLDALHETGVGLGVVAHFLVTLVRHPDEAIAIEFHAIRVPSEIALGLSRADASPAADSRRAHPSPCSVCSSADRDCRSR